MRITRKQLDYVSKIHHVGWFAVNGCGTLILDDSDERSKEHRGVDGVVCLKDNGKFLKGCGICCLGMVSGGRLFVLPEGKSGYFQSKTASSSPGAGTELESRNIGYREGNMEIVLRVKEGTYECTLEVGEISNA